MPRGETLVDQTIFGFDVRGEYQNFDALAEVYVINNDNKVGLAEKHQARAAFLQAGYRIDPKWKAVVRTETVQSDDDDDYFLLLGRQDHDHRVVAVRYDIDDSSALKLQLDRAIPETGSAENTYTLQWSFLIP